jgi:hypothetical protein
MEWARLEKGGYLVYGRKQVELELNKNVVPK